MEITLEALHRFVADFGNVSILDRAGEIQKLKDGSPDVWALVEKADTFIFAGSRYSRADFAKVMDRMTTKPGNAFQIG